ncbi:hypothetical protein KP509_22G024500 [Ceratopteris richardii]|uniref:Uncharacterized protein n=1 Tax=Ceratopteris richardii TaxID=49495 RepID=A0A8T2S6P9_CERRI|nr:hypothetical protein KP509_22G024500 [Ceratopteris richardii]
MDRISRKDQGVLPSSLVPLTCSSIMDNAPLSVGSPLKLLSNGSRMSMSAERKEVRLATEAAFAVLAPAVIPKIAEAAPPRVSPSLKNFLLSVVTGDGVLVAIGDVEATVFIFDPVKRKSSPIIKSTGSTRMGRST